MNQPRFSTSTVKTTSAEDYVARIYEKVQARNSGEPEFHQAVKEFLDSIVPALQKRTCL